jgi:hypothetical protein
MSEAFDYAELTEEVDDAIQLLGQAGTIIRRGAATGTPYNPTPGAPVNHSCTLVVGNYRNNEIDGSRVLASDKKVVIAKGSLTIEPSLSDKLVIGGVEHAILDVQPISPGGTVLMFEVQARR